MHTLAQYPGAFAPPVARYPASSEAWSGTVEDSPRGDSRLRRRKRLLVRADRNVDIQAYVSTWLARVKAPASVRVRVDVDPYSFL